MSSTFPPPSDIGSFPDDDTGLCYSLEVIAELAGVVPQTVIRYQEQGFLRPVAWPEDSSVLFDAEGLRQLRRIEHLRATCEFNESGLRLILSLLQEVEQLRQETRQSRRGIPW